MKFSVADQKVFCFFFLGLLIINVILSVEEDTRRNNR